MYTFSVTFNFWPPVFVMTPVRGEATKAAPKRRSLDETIGFIESVTQPRDIVTESHTPRVTRKKAVRAPKSRICPYCNDTPLRDGQEACSPKCRKRKERLTKKKTASKRKPS